MNSVTPVNSIHYDHVERVVDTLCEAFYEYPVMRYVLDADGGEFDQQYPKLIRLFVMARVLSDEPLFGMGELERLDAASVVSLPETQGVPERLVELRRTTWQDLGQEARQRYDNFCGACATFDVAEPHHHLNMIGVRNSCQGMGYGRRLVEHVISLSDAHLHSTGVSLSTENPSNVPFYTRLGFELIGHAKVGPGLETWNFFRTKG